MIKAEANPGPFGVPTIDVLYLTLYRYDEAGNRISKFRYKYTGCTPDPIFEGDNPSWTLQSGEYYVRDVSGMEIAIYSGSSLTQWNIWGLDNLGKINADTTRNYYLKDHLGSIRVVLNSTNTVISAQDYDAWGYPLENRTYNASAMKYDFTGKERDDETSYDYFGARYYDSRIGRWGQVEPLLNKYLNTTPYNYSFNRPTVVIDPNGMSGEPVLDRTNRTVTVTSNIIFYGDDGSSDLSTKAAQNIQDQWNAANGSVNIEGDSFNVKFVVTGTYDNSITSSDIANNTDIKNNYIKIVSSGVDVSFMDGVGSNTGVFLASNINDASSTTESHEFGHGYGLAHPGNDDIRGLGRPSIMFPRGTAVDADYTYDPKLGDTYVDPSDSRKRSNTMNPNSRVVTQTDIDNLGLDKVDYETSTGVGKLGKLTNIAH